MSMFVTFTEGTLEEGLRWVGRESPLFHAIAPIEYYPVRHWAEMVEDPNPNWWVDPRSPGPHEAPPASLMMWGLPHVWAPAPEERGATVLLSQIPLPYTRAVLVDLEMKIFQPLRVGEVLLSQQRIEAIVPKRTRLGEGAFITQVTSYWNEVETPLGEIRIVTLRYSPEDEGREAP